MIGTSCQIRSLIARGHREEKIYVNSGSSPIFIDVYRDDEVLATAVKEYTLTADDLASPHDWEIRVHGAVAAPYNLALS